MYIFDTDHLGFLQAARGEEYANLQHRLKSIPSESFFVTIVSFHEQFMGWNAYLQRAKSAEGVVKAYDRMAKIVNDFALMQMLPFDDAAAAEFNRLKSQRVQLGAMDLRLAAIGLSRDFVILTRNFADFSKVPGLKYEDWTTPIQATDD